MSTIQVFAKGTVQIRQPQKWIEFINGLREPTRAKLAHVVAFSKGKEMMTCIYSI